MQDDLKERLRRIVKKPYSAKRGPPPCEPQMLDRIAALEAKLAEKDALLRECGEALAEYACHGGPDLPCIRSKDQCRTECGKIAGDALAKIKDATDADRQGIARHFCSDGTRQEGTQPMKDLIEKLAQAEGPGRELDAEISRALAGGPADHWYQDHRGVYVTDNCAPCYTASIDAAMTLIEPHGYGSGPWSSWNWAIANMDTAATPALALCIAALSAKEPSQ